MNVAVLIIRVLLTLLFFLSGAMKLIQPKEKLASYMAWVEGFSQSQVRLIGVLEALEALGLILPSLIGILPWLSPRQRFVYIS
jgi:uncharacterized membrane protein YphA (DoxX/SURF4 family)